MITPALADEEVATDSQPSSTYQNHDYLEEARLAFKGGNYTEAERLFKLVLTETGYTFKDIASEIDPQKPVSVITPIADILSNEQDMPWVIYNPLKVTSSGGSHNPAQDILSSMPNASLVRQAAAANDLAFVYLMTGNFANAEPLLQHALKLRTQLSGSNHPQVAQTLNNLGGLYYTQNDFKSALNFFALATTIWAKLSWPKTKDADLSLKNYLALLRKDGKSPAAANLETEVQTIRSKQNKTAMTPEFIPDGSLWSTYVFAGQQEFQQGQLQESEQFFKRALKEAQLDDPNSKKVADSLHVLAAFYQDQKRYAEAEELYLSALDLMQKQVYWQPVDFIQTLDNLAVIYMEQERYSDAEPILKQLADIKGKAEETKRWALGQVLSNLALVLFKKHKTDDSERVCKQILEIYQDPSKADYVQSMQALARVYQEQGKSTKADDLYGRALAEIQQSDGDGSYRAATVFKDRADYFKEQKRWDDALPLYDRGLKIFGDTCKGADLIFVLDGYTTCLVESNRNSEAEPLLKRQLSLLATDEKANWQLKLDTLAKLSKAYRATNKIALMRDTQIQQIEARQKRLEQLSGKKREEAKQALADEYISVGAYKNALPLVLETVTVLFEQGNHTDRLQYARWLDKLANVQLYTGQNQDAITNSNQVVRIVEHCLGSESNVLMVALRHYAQALAWSGNIAMASNVSYRADRIEQVLRVARSSH